MENPSLEFVAKKIRGLLEQNNMRLKVVKSYTNPYGDDPPDLNIHIINKSDQGDFFAKGVLVSRE